MDIFYYREHKDHHLGKQSCSVTEFVFYNISLAFVNHVRRLILTEVESWAVENVIFETNTTQFHDEVIAHRLSLCPIEVTLPQTSPLEATVPFDFTGPKILCSEDFDSSNLNFAPNIQICPLYGSDQLKGYIHIVAGTGAIHSKWNVANSWLALTSSCDHLKCADSSSRLKFALAYQIYTPKQDIRSCISLYVESYTSITNAEILKLAFDRVIQNSSSQNFSSVCN